MAKYIIVDAANLFFRCRYATQGDSFTKVGMAFHIMFRSLKKVWRDVKADHIVFCFEGGSGWRRELYPDYKAHRRLQRLEMTPREQEDDEIFMTALQDFTDFISQQTRCTALQSPGIEGDDFVARWIQLYPNDSHVILSGDSDFVQLLADNVAIYDGMNEHTLIPRGVFNAAGESLEFSIKSNSKLKIGKPAPEFVAEDRWWERALFTKIVRGDPGDNIYAAYPKVRETKLKEAYADRAAQGYAWNNFMLQTWAIRDEKPIRVLDAYQRNAQLIDLTQQPEAVKANMDAVISVAVHKDLPGNPVGINFLRFCDRNALPNLSREAVDHCQYLNQKFQ